MQNYQVVLFFVTSLTLAASGCAPAEPELPELTVEPDSPSCVTANGFYKATFTLRDTEGECGEAKEQSHDPLEFDGEGRFKSPADGLVECKTLQAGCQLAVRCTSSVMESAKAGLDAELSPDAELLTGSATVEGSYKGCRRLVYDVVAVRRTDAAN